MKNRESLLMLNVLLISLSLYLPPCGASEDSATSSTTATIYSVADAYVSSSSPDENHGDLNSMYVGASSEQDFTYVMFNLSSIPSDAEIISATLKFYLSSTEGEIYGSPADTIGTHYCSDNSWTELGITWNNKPDFNLEPTSTWAFSLIYTVKVYKSWDITEDVKMALPSGILTEVLKFESKTGDRSAIFQSRESLSDPKLEVEYVAYTLQIKAATGGATDPPSSSYAYVIGRVVSVLATSMENYVLDHWELDSIDAGSDNPIEVIMNSNHTLQPVFRLVTFNLTIIAGDGGMTSPMPAIRTYTNNTSVSVTAISNLGYSFDRWLLDGGKRTVLSTLMCPFL
jgi:hypothetical protein